MARAQQAALPVVGFLGPGSPESDAYRVTAFNQGLKEAGFVDGQNIRIEYRWAKSHYVELQNLAADLVRARDFGFMKAVAKIESDFDPKQRVQLRPLNVRINVSVR